MKGVDTKKVIELIFIIVIFLLFFPIINAGPYGYGDSMDLKYHVVQSGLREEVHINKDSILNASEPQN